MYEHKSSIFGTFLGETENFRGKNGALRCIITWQGSLEGNPSVLIGSPLVGISPYRFHGNGHKLRIFCFRKRVNSKKAWPKCHIINYLLTERESLIGEYWPSVVFVRCARSVLPQPRANIP